MKTSTVLFALLSIASAEVAARQQANSTTGTPATTTYVDNSPQATCLAACNPTDVNCRAGCVGGAHPNPAQVNQTYDCITGCPVGDGSKAQTDQYNSCVQSCITSHYLGGSTAGPVTVGTGSTSMNAQTTGTGAAASKSTGTGAVQSTGSATADGSKTATTRASKSGATPSGSAAPGSTSNAASGPLFVSAGGIAGLFLAFFAL